MRASVSRGTAFGHEPMFNRFTAQRRATATRPLQPWSPTKASGNYGSALAIDARKPAPGWAMAETGQSQSVTAGCPAAGLSVNAHIGLSALEIAEQTEVCLT